MIGMNEISNCGKNAAKTTKEVIDKSNLIHISLE